MDEATREGAAAASHTAEASKPAASSPGETFINLVGGMVDQGDVNAIIVQQTAMLGRFEKTNEKLERFNSLESGRFNQAMEQFRSHTRVLTDMKKDLDSVFRRIRLLRGKLSRQYPDVFEAFERENGGGEHEEEKEEEEATAATPGGDRSSDTLVAQDSTAAAAAVSSPDAADAAISGDSSKVSASVDAPS